MSSTCRKKRDKAIARHLDMRRDNPLGKGDVHFYVERSLSNNCGFVVEECKWDPEDFQSYCGNDIRCFLCTLLGMCDCARPLIARYKYSLPHDKERRDFVLMKERVPTREVENAVFRLKPIESEFVVKPKPGY